MSHFKVIFHLDGTGILYNPSEPPMLDSRLALMLGPHQRTMRRIDVHDMPDDIQLPLMQSTIRGYTLWHASAILPAREFDESLFYIRRRFPESEAHLTTGTFQLTEGATRNHNIPYQELLADTMVAYGSGNAKEVKRVLGQLKYLGKKSTGVIVDIDIEHIEEDYSFVKDGKAMRWLPDEHGMRNVRVKPPYWNLVSRVKCCEVGDTYVR